jgi:hypothetical protein
MGPSAPSQRYHRRSSPRHSILRQATEGHYQRRVEFRGDCQTREYRTERLPARSAAWSPDYLKRRPIGSLPLRLTSPVSRGSVDFAHVNRDMECGIQVMGEIDGVPCVATFGGQGRERNGVGAEADDVIRADHALVAEAEAAGEIEAVGEGAKVASGVGGAMVEALVVIGAEAGENLVGGVEIAGLGETEFADQAVLAGAPGALDAFEKPDQQQAEVSPRRQARPPHLLRIEMRALLLEKLVKAAPLQHSVELFIERMRHRPG